MQFNGGTGPTMPVTAIGLTTTNEIADEAWPGVPRLSRSRRVNNCHSCHCHRVPASQQEHKSDLDRRSTFQAGHAGAVTAEWICLLHTGDLIARSLRED